MITLDNYEEFFLLYVDNELSATERKAVESFVEANPGIRDEWETILQSRISPDNWLGFGDKRSLLSHSMPGQESPAKQVPAFAGPLPSGSTGQADNFDPANYQESLLSYIDGELDEVHRLSLEGFLRTHPLTKKELDQLLLTVSEPDLSVTYQDKELLYRHPSLRRTPVLPWFRIAAAAAIFGAVAIFILLRAGHQAAPAAPDDFANKMGGKKKNDPAAVTPNATRSLQDAEQQPFQPAPAIAQKVLPAKVPSATVPSTDVRSADGRSADVRPTDVRSVDVRSANVQLASNTADPANPHHNPVASDQLAVLVGQRNTASQDGFSSDQVDTSDNLRVAAVRTAPRRLGIPKGQSPGTNTAQINTGDVPVMMSSYASQALLSHSGGSREDGIIPADDAPQKTRFRGLLRKVSRTFGKKVSKVDEDLRTVSVGPFEFTVQ